MNYQELKNLVKKHSELYYDKAKPVLADAEWDEIYSKLEAMETAQGWRDSDSPTILVGGSSGKITHPVKLYSLRKVYDQEEVDPLFDVKTPKIDGTNLTLVYRKGKLILALTRGNGEKGDSVTHLVDGITNVPKTIKTMYKDVIVNGECVTNNTVDNFRNYVSGSLGLKSLEEFKKRNICFIAHDWLNIEMDYIPRMNILKGMGFFTALEEKAYDYLSDGLVFRFNSYKKSKDLGYTAKYPRFAIALKKREVETAVTTLQDVVWAIGRTGTVNPIGIIDPVTLEDAVISKVTLHNIGIIEEHNIGLGDLIQIERAGGVIPKFLRVVEHSKHNIKINKEHAEKAISLPVARNGPKLVVIDKDNANSDKMLEHFIKTMGIKGLGPASVKKLNLKHPTDIYTTNDWDVLGANGEKVKEEVERSKRVPYEVVLAALGIPGVGKSAAKLITSRVTSFSSLRDVDVMPIKGIGPSTITSILSWLDFNEDWVYDLPLQLEQELTVEKVEDKGKKVCITGKLDMSRSQLKDILEGKGYKVTSTVTKDCYALINGGDSSSSKYIKAKNSGVNIVDYWSSKKDVLSGNF